MGIASRQISRHFLTLGCSLAARRHISGDPEMLEIKCFASSDNMLMLSNAKGTWKQGPRTKRNTRCKNEIKAYFSDGTHQPLMASIFLINYNTWTPRRTRKREEMEKFKFLISIFIKFGERWRSSNEKWRPEKMFEQFIEQFSIATFNKKANFSGWVWESCRAGGKGWGGVVRGEWRAHREAREVWTKKGVEGDNKGELG